jgi:ABC-type spermidine/putrescine transport system permease subunit I
MGQSLMRGDAAHVASRNSAPLWLAMAFLPGLLIVGCLVLYPLGLAVGTSLRLGAGGPTLAQYVALLTGDAGPDVLFRTVGLALATMIGSIVLSIPLGYLARDSGWIGTTIRTLVALPLAVPVLIAGYALMLFFTDNGLFNNVLVHVLHVLARPVHIAYTWGGLVAACIWRFFPYTGLMVIAALQAVDQRLEEAAASTGATPLQVFWRVTLPLIMPATITGGILTFVSAFGTFSIPLVMGRSTDVLSVLAYRPISGTFDWPAASTTVVVMSVIQIAILVGLRSGVARWARRA